MFKYASVETPFLWMIFSFASMLLSIIIIAFFNYRRQLPIFHNFLASISFIIVSLFIFSLGPYFESCSWIILTKGITVLCFTDIFNTSFSIHYLNNLVIMLFSASATMVVAYISKSFRHKLLFAWLTAFLAISFTDIIFHSLKNVGLVNIFFSFLSNIIGGFLLGLIVAYVNVFIDNIVFKQYSKSIIISHFKYLTILLGGLSFFSLGVYFLFIFQIDYNFQLTLNKWETVAFHYNSSDVTYGNIKYVMIPFKTESLYAGNVDNKIDIVWGFGPNDNGRHYNGGKTKFAIFNIKAIKKDIIYDKLINPGNIELFGNGFIINFQTENKNRSYDFFALIPEKDKIMITNNRNLLPISSIINNPLKENYGNPKKLVGLISEKGGIKAIFRGIENMTFSIVPKLFFFKPPLEGDKNNWEIRLPGESKPIIIDRDNYNLMVLGKKDGQKYIEINSNFKVLEFENSDYSLETCAGYLNPTKIGDFSVSLPRGNLNVGGKKIQLQNDYNLILGGEDIEIKQNIGDEEISLKGSTDRIILNNIPYSLSYWSSLSNEVQNGVVAGAFMIFGTLLGYFLGKKNRT